MKQFMVTQEFIDYFKENKRLSTWEIGEIIEEHKPFNEKNYYRGIVQTEELTLKEVSLLQETFSQYRYSQRFQITKEFKEIYPDDFQQERIITIVGLYKNAVVLATVYKAVKYPLSVLSLLT